MKAKYDREGVKFIDEESQMGRKDLHPAAANKDDGFFPKPPVPPRGRKIGPKHPGDVPLQGYGHPAKNR